MKITYKVVSGLGLREDMEDSYCFRFPFVGSRSKFFAGVFDGHGGCAVANYAASNLPDCFATALANSKSVPRAFKHSHGAVDGALSHHNHCGACTLVVFFDGIRIHHANTGDCSMFVTRRSGGRIVTNCHRVGNKKEESRVRGLGGEIVQSHLWIPSGDGLQPLRTIGDRAFRKYGVIPEPEYGSFDVVSPTLLVLGTDGLFDEVSVADIKKTAVLSTSVNDIAMGLKSLVRGNVAMDNYTFIVILLQP